MEVIYFPRSQNSARPKIALRHAQKVPLIFPIDSDGEHFVAHAVRSPIQRFGYGLQMKTHIL
jgi:hypothetical protein